MKVRLSEEVQKYLHKISQKNPKLALQIQKQLLVFIENPRHPSLRTHKLAGKLNNLYSISVDKNIRMTYLWEEDEAYFTKIGTHDEVYRKS